MRALQLGPVLTFAALLLAACASGGREHDASGADLRIKTAMERLGASSERGDCFARRVAGALNEEDEEEAAEIVEGSDSKEEMRESVLGASNPVRQAFIGANLGCSLFG